MRIDAITFSLVLAVAAFVGPPANAQGEAAPAATSAKSATPKPASDGRALDPVTRRVRQMADELRSPFCPGKTLMTCTSYQAFELRREIEAMVRSGMNDDEIMKKLKTVHGDEISNPKQPWYTFFVPFLPFIVLAGLIFWVVRRWRRGGEAPALGEADFAAGPEHSATPVDEDRRARLRARVRDDET